jgi:hypothetical protein
MEIRLKRVVLMDQLGTDFHAIMAAAQALVILRLLARLQTVDGPQANLLLWKTPASTCSQISRAIVLERLSILTFTKTMIAQLTITQLQNQ